MPGLGLKRGLGDELVVAPYATALAALVDPAAAAREPAAARPRRASTARFGFYEAIDYTPREADDAERRGRRAAGAARRRGPRLPRAPPGHDARRARQRAARRRDRRRASTPTRACRRPSCCCRSACRAQARRRRAAAGRGDARRGAGAAAVAVAPLPLAAHARPARAVPVERPLRHGRHQRRRRRQLLPRPARSPGGGEDRDRATPAASSSTCATSAAGTVWSADLSADRPRARRLRGRRSSPRRRRFRRRDDDIETQLEIAVSPEDDVEVRRLSITNHGDRAARDRGHQLRRDRAGARRRTTSRTRRSASCSSRPSICRAERRRCCSAGGRARRTSRRSGRSTCSASRAARRAPVEWETDRARFLGRGRDAGRSARARRPGAVAAPPAPCSIRSSACASASGWRPAASSACRFATGVAADRDAALALAQQVPRRRRRGARLRAGLHPRADRAAAPRASSSDEALLFERLASRVLFVRRVAARRAGRCWRATRSASRACGATASPATCRSCSCASPRSDDLPLVRQVLQAQEYWRAQGAARRRRHPQRAPGRLPRRDAGAAHRRSCRSRAGPAGTTQPGGMFLLRGDGMPEAERRLLAAVARVVLRGDRGELAPQLDRPAPWLYPADDVPRRQRTLRPPTPADAPMPVPPLVHGERPRRLHARRPRVRRRARRRPRDAAAVGERARQSRFGTIVTASGAAFTWAENSRENRLTPFANDPVTDPTARGDLPPRRGHAARSGAPTPGAAAAPARDAGRWVVRHARRRHALPARGARHARSELDVFVDAGRSGEVVAADADQHVGDAPRALSVFGYVEWCLGPPRAGRRAATSSPSCDAATRRDPRAQRLQRRSSRTASPSGARSEPPRSATGDRARVRRPQRHAARAGRALPRARSPARFGAGLDPCAALQVVRRRSRPARSRRVAFVLGQGARRGARARRWSRATRTLDAARGGARPRSSACWDETLGAVQVTTPDDSFDLIVNRWLLYQTLSCRIWARTRLLPAGRRLRLPRSAPGRAGAALRAARSSAREHLLRAAGAPVRRGRRAALVASRRAGAARARAAPTTCSGCRTPSPHYVARDRRRGGARRARAVPRRRRRSTPDEHEAYGLPRGLRRRRRRSSSTASARSTAAMTVGRARPAADRQRRLERRHEPRRPRGPRRERRGSAGSCTSCCNEFAPLCDARGDRRPRRALPRRGAAAGRHARAGLGRRLVPPRLLRRRHAARLGAERRVPHRLDRAVVGGALGRRAAALRRARHGRGARAPGARATRSSCCCSRRRSTASAQDPGYIKGYLPGVRENGGQYTHAALWMVMALARLGQRRRGDGAVPHAQPDQPHAHAPTDVERYKAEPYVVAGDVYAHPPHVGRGGWTWYTGSAGWMYRVGAREHPRPAPPRRRPSRIDPCIPSSWPGFAIDWRVGAHALRDRGRRTPSAAAAASPTAELDGARGRPARRSRCVDDGGRTRCAGARRASRASAGPRAAAPALIRATRGGHAGRRLAARASNA